MPDLGLEVLLKGSNMLRLLQGLWVALRISLIAVVISIPLGLLFGVLMTRKNVVLKAIFRVYLEFIRIMPQLVLLFLFYFSTTRTFGWNLSGETASIIVFVLWGTAEMSDLVPGMELTGTVRNIVDFGAFVDIGVHQDGLVHISRICDKFIRHPSEVLKPGDIVTVWVLEVDQKKKRISLTMKKPQ